MTFCCNKFSGHYPVPVAAVVDAETPESAAEILNQQLRSRSLPGDAEPNDCIPFPSGGCVILSDGDY